MLKYRLRKATDADMPAIIGIINHAIAHTTSVWSLTPVTLEASMAWMDDRQARGFPVIVAESCEAKPLRVILGFASFGDFRAWEGYRHTVEHSLYVAPHAQRMGIGSALLRELIARAQALQIQTMVAGIESGNLASIALHKHQRLPRFIRACATVDSRVEQLQQQRYARLLPIQPAKQPRHVPVIPQEKDDGPPVLAA